MPTNLSAIPPPRADVSRKICRVCETSRLIGWEWKLFRQVGSRVTNAPRPLVYFAWSILGLRIRMAEQHSNVIRECNNWTAENYPFPIRKLAYDKEKLSLRFQDLYQRMHNSEIKRSRRGKKKERKEGRKISKVKLILVTRRDGFHGRQRISTLWINFERIITRW